MAPLALPPQADENLSRRLELASLELRAAVIACDHAAAQTAVLAYVDVLRQFGESLPVNERSASIPARAQELLSWAREMTIIQHALAGDQLRILQIASRYQNAIHSGTGFEVKG